MKPPRVRSVRAFAPGHITGVFRPDTSNRDPRGRGSVGAGLVLDLGAWADARFVPGPRHRVTVAGEGSGPWPISEEVARRLASGLPGTLSVRLEHELPVGQGFGMSAAGALATALAVGALAGAPRARSVEVAHLADLFGGGGLGGVAAILGGGMEVRTRAGIPPFGRVVHRRLGHPFLVGVVGKPIPSPSVLGDRASLRRIALASRGWEVLKVRPSAGAFFRWSERFTDRARLSSPAVVRAVRELRRRGAWAGQAMFGESFFACPRSPTARAECVRWLADEGVHAVETRTATNGARLAGPRAR